MNKMAMIILAAAILVSGCATVKGVGRDIESVGKAGQDVIKGK